MSSDSKASKDVIPISLLFLVRNSFLFEDLYFLFRLFLSAKANESDGEIRLTPISMEGNDDDDAIADNKDHLIDLFLIDDIQYRNTALVITIG